MKFLLIAVLFALAYSALACDLTVHVRAATAKRFTVLVTPPSGEPQRWTFQRNRQKETFHQRQNDCVLGDWTIQTYNPDNAVVGTVRVTLDGVGRVLYEVDDGLQLTMVERQGATCTGQCAPLANNVGGGSRSNSPFNNRYENNY